MKNERQAGETKTLLDSVVVLESPLTTRRPRGSGER